MSASVDAILPIYSHIFNIWKFRYFMNERDNIMWQFQEDNRKNATV